MTKLEQQEFWFDIIKKQRLSGQTVKEFVNARQLSYSVFFKQLRSYRSLGLDSATGPSQSVQQIAMNPKALTPLRFAAVQVDSTPSPVPSPQLFLKHGSGWSLEIPATATPQWIGDLLRGISA